MLKLVVAAVLTFSFISPSFAGGKNFFRVSVTEVARNGSCVEEVVNQVNTHVLSQDSQIDNLGGIGWIFLSTTVGSVEYVWLRQYLTDNLYAAAVENFDMTTGECDVKEVYNHGPLFKMFQ